MIPSIAHPAANTHAPTAPSQSHRPTSAPTASRAQPPAQDTAEFTARPLESTHETDREPGAYRLLKEGHFKGVAEIRQRIHFADRIADEQAQAQASLTNDSLTGLNEAVSDALAGLADTQPLTEEQAASIDQLQQAFSTSVSALTGSAPTGDSSSQTQLSLEEISAALREAGDTLLQGLTDLSAPPPPADDTDTPPPGDPETPEAPAEEDVLAEPTLDLTDFINSLNELLDTRIGSFINEADSLSILSELSGPIGQGVAYDKHLATYLSLQSASDDTEQAPAISDEVAIDIFA